MENQSSGKGRKFTRTDFLNIRQLIIQGIPLKVIAKKYKVNDKRIKSVYREFNEQMIKVRTSYKPAVMGYKDDSYYTEDEMIEGMPLYHYNELSDSEKAFYEIRTGIRKFNKVNR